MFYVVCDYLGALDARGRKRQCVTLEFHILG